MSIPPELADSPLAPLATRLERAERDARRARREAAEADAIVARAEKADITAAAQAAADDKPAPKPSKPAALAAAEKARTSAAVATETYQLLERRLVAALSGTEGQTWRTQLHDGLHAASEAVDAALQAVVTANAEMVAARRVLRWLDDAPDRYARTGRLPILPTPPSTVQVGATTIDILRLLETIAAWATVEDDELLQVAG